MIGLNIDFFKDYLQDRLKNDLIQIVWCKNVCYSQEHSFLISYPDMQAEVFVPPAITPKELPRPCNFDMMYVHASN